MIFCQMGDLVKYNCLLSITKFKSYDNIALGLVVKKNKLTGDFGQNELGSNIQYPEYVYTLLSLGQFVEVLDVDLIERVD